MLIYVDDREPMWVVIALRRYHGQDQVIVKRLERGHGDVVGGHLGFERKEVVDLISSIADGRLITQMNLMGIFCEEHGKIGHLVVHGDLDHGMKTYREHSGAGINENEVIHRITEACVRNDITAYWMPTASLAVKLIYETLMIANTGNLYNRKINKLKSKWKREAPDKKTWFLANALQIDTAMMKALIDRFGGIIGLQGASIRELTEVPGVGRVTASKIKGMLGA